MRSGRQRYVDVAYRIKVQTGQTFEQYVLGRLDGDPDLTIPELARQIGVDPQRMYWWLGKWGWRTGRGPRLVRAGGE